jgi:hypothetical protein
VSRSASSYTCVIAREARRRFAHVHGSTAGKLDRFSLIAR